MINLDNISIVLVCGKDDLEHIKSSFKAMKYSCLNINFFEKILISPKIYDEDFLNELNNFGITHHIIEPINYIEYNNFMVKRLYDYIKSDFCITIQNDGFIINPYLWKDEFLHYDYIGAPWSDYLIQSTDAVFNYVKENRKYSLVGNGGFSFRSKKLLKETKNSPYNCDIQKINNFSLKTGEVGEHVMIPMPEDNYICLNYYEYFIERGIKYAPIELANIFSTEVPQYPNKNSFGFHGDRNLVNILLNE
jgi:hypothetical protein